MKKYLKALIAAVFMTLLLSVNVFAANEIEPNDDMAKATVISVNTEHTGSIDNKTDVDWYKFILDKPGRVNVLFKHNNTVGNLEWYLSIYDSEGRTIAGYEEIQIKGDDISTNSTAMLGLPCGTYFIKVRPRNEYWWDSDPYYLNVNYEESNTWETEDNYDPDNSDDIKVNTEYKGTILSKNDEDYFKFTIDNPGRVQIDFKHESRVGSHYWYVGLFDDKENAIAGYGKGKGEFEVKGDDISLNSSANFGLPAGTYYVRIRSTSYQFSTDPYSFKVNYEKSDVWEQEENHDKDAADSIELNKYYYGAVLSSDDEDWYKVKLNESGNLWVGFTHDERLDSSSYWKLSIRNSKGDLVTENSEYFFKGNDISLIETEKYKLSAGTYYIKISPCYIFYLSTQPYKFKVNFSKAPTAKNLKNATVTGLVNKKYTGRAITQNLKVTLGSKTLKKDTDYTLKYSNNKSVGTATITIKAKGDVYTGSKTVTFKINKATNSLKISGKTVDVKSKDVRKKPKTLSVSKVFNIQNKGQGGLSFKKKNGNSKITVKSKGTITVKKGLKSGRYPVNVEVKAKGNENYKKATKIVTVYIRVK